MSGTGTRVPPPVILAGALATQALLTRGPGVREVRGRRAVAIGLAGAAVGVAAAAGSRFRAAHTTFDAVHPEEASTLVTGGVLDRTRNPMYLGLVLLATANAARTGHTRSLLPVAALLVWLDRVQVPAEEEALRARFGAEYDDYAARVRRWL